jgi:tryptophanyl-tRNA synthetase
VGTDGRAKMSKSLNNAVYLADDADTVKQRVRRMVTDVTGENPRLRATDPGVVEYNPAFLYHDAFNDNVDEVAELKERYTAGAVSDVEVKDRLSDALNRFLDPIRGRRVWYEEHPGYVRDALMAGTERERAIARQTIEDVRQAMQVVYA